MQTKNLTKLKINKLTQAQYNAALEANTIQGNELYMVTDSVLDISKGGTGAKTAAEARINLGVEPTIYDSGWKTATLGSSFITYNGNTVPKYRKIGRLIELTGSVKPKSSIAGSATQHTILTLPYGYRPSREMMTICQGSGINIWTLRIGTTGVVSFERYRNGSGYIEASTGTWLPFHTMFFAED